MDAHGNPELTDRYFYLEIPGTDAEPMIKHTKRAGTVDGTVGEVETPGATSPEREETDRA